jgi:PTS system nitrogen regulatory IIA component
MIISELLELGCVRYEAQASSKKQALDVLGTALAGCSEGLKPGVVLEGLVSRERLGSTALGDSVAMPHARIEGIGRSHGAFLRLGNGVDFEASDGKAVDLLFGLLMPLDCSDNEIEDLRQLIEHLRDPILQEQLRQTDRPEDLYALLTDSLTAVYRKISI